MELRFDFASLWSIVREVTSDVDSFSFAEYRHMDPIDIALSEKGIDVKLDELEDTGGLLAYQGRQILLYIPDHGKSVQAALQEPKSKGRKFHVAHCETLVMMRSRNRFERYVATAKLDGLFQITGTDEFSTAAVSGDARLAVCKFCLKHLNYKKSALSTSLRNDVCNNFDISEFFETYSSCFTYLPKRHEPGENDGAYTSDWPEVSSRVRAEAIWHCDECRIDLSDHRHLLHVHHVDGVKRNNKGSNLRPLCAACHRDQPMHDRMFIKASDMSIINKKRRDSGQFKPSWDVVSKLADPALRGMLELAKQRGLSAPELSLEVQSSSKSVVLDVAWTKDRIGVYLTKDVQPAIHNWTTKSLSDALVWLQK